MIKNLEKFRTTVENGLLDGMTIEHIYSLCVQFGSIDSKMPERAFLQAIQEEAFEDGERALARRAAAEVMFCLKEPSGIMMRIQPVNPKTARIPSVMTMLLADMKYNVMWDRKRNALVGLNLLQEAISKEAIERDQIAILDSGNAAACANNYADLIMAGMKAWIALFSACSDNALEMNVFQIEEPSPCHFNDV